ncbi:quinolinate synthase NadA [Candidatus Galacturonibacter soehngenii]|uniref:Quinolinate synthase n=1 Tax=Candidatus Galacturonatibacter soehngenii TaxID=2307010 RepID=A0A7V7UC87_9FIRM|nr:quinolinate synthase NadA [Candidatus Galacturonibacter soehngenii]KAB1439445.1 quinolinate synthase NadA [Candidatus Galacturonibacter soehngenii]
MDNIQEEINQLKQEKDAVILAHYYVADEIQDIADYIGDSYYLSEIATKLPQKTICFAGVKFMGESAKILCPDKTVLLPEVLADCPMANMAEEEKILKIREQYKDLAVVCYINSSARLKTFSDVIVTSSNALKIVKALPQKNIYFIPDENLGRYIASQVPDKNFIFNKGFCHVHTSITKENVLKAKAAKPNMEILVHPECKMEILELADYIGSTSGIINYATKSEKKEFLICTELGILHDLKKKNPEKSFYSVGHRQFCPNMKKITLQKIKDSLQSMKTEVKIDEDLRIKAYRPLIRMLELAK